MVGKKIEELGMKAFLAVAKGSEKEPQLIVMEYEGGDPDSKEKNRIGRKRPNLRLWWILY